MIAPIEWFVGLLVRDPEYTEWLAQLPDPATRVTRMGGVDCIGVCWRVYEDGSDVG